VSRPLSRRNAYPGAYVLSAAFAAVANIGCTYVRLGQYLVVGFCRLSDPLRRSWKPASRALSRPQLWQSNDLIATHMASR